MLPHFNTAELRNRIYSFVFDSVASKDHSNEFKLLSGHENHERHIALLKARSPAVGLLRTCKQVHSDTHGLFDDFYRKDHWANTLFVIDQFTPLERLRKQSHVLSDENMAMITRLVVRGSRHEVVMKDGVWYVPHPRKPKIKYRYVLVPDSYTQELLMAKGLRSRPLLRPEDRWWLQEGESLPRVINVTHMGRRRIEEMKSLVGRKTLTRGEILAFAIFV